jgi:hypothetical protein
LSLNPGTGEISGTPTAAALVAGSPTGSYTGIEVTADGTVVSKPITINLLGVSLPAPIFFSPMSIDEDTNLVFDGSGYLPAAVNGSPTEVPGVEGDALNFTLGDYLSVAHDAALSIGTNDYTITGSVKVAGGTSDIELLNKIDLLANPGWRVLVEPTLTTLNHGDGSGLYLNLTFAHASIDDGSHHTVVVSVDRDVAAEVYMDGASIGTNGGVFGDQNSIDTTEPMYIGANEVAGVNAVTTGEVDNVALFLSALSADQAATITWLNMTGGSIASWIRGAPPGPPTYANQSLQDGVAVTPGVFVPTVPAGDDEGIFSYVTVDALPVGLSLNTVTGEVTGTPVLSIGSGGAASLGVPTAATGTLTTDFGNNIVDGETFTLDDGVNPPVVFEFDFNSSVIETPTLRQVAFTIFDSQGTVRDRIITAVTNAPTLDITASIGGASQVNLVNDNAGVDGNVAITQTGTPLLGITGMAGGTDITVTGLAGMTTASVGRTLVLTGVVNPLNGGTFDITAYNSATSVDIAARSQAGIFAPGSEGGITWEERGQVSRAVRIGASDGLHLSFSDSFIVNVT